MTNPLPAVKQLDSYVAGARLRFEEMLGELVEIPTISADPNHRQDVDRGARLAAQLLEKVEATAEVVGTDWQPRGAGEAIDGPVQPDHHRLQPPGRAARPGAGVDPGPLRLPSRGRALLWPRLYRRQGPGPDRPASGPLRGELGGARQLPFHLGDRGGNRQPQLRAVHPEQTA